MKIDRELVKQRLREAHWAWWLPAAFFVGVCVVPAGTIEASPGQYFHPPVLAAPSGWPLLVMGLVFGAAAFAEKLRRRAFHILLAGTSLSLLFELALVAFQGGTGYYSWVLGTDLDKRIFTDFELDVLAFGVIPMDLFLAGGSFIVLWSREFRLAPAEAAPESWVVAPPSQPSPAREPAPPAPAAQPEAPEITVAQPPAPETLATQPARPFAPGTPATQPARPPAPEPPAVTPTP
ncbi:MAG: hypothetical protein FJ149_08175 [Euryarchaeota archaeon]|nr:hypothetical protein [Euryarchaeota archaeon]